MLLTALSVVLGSGSDVPEDRLRLLPASPVTVHPAPSPVSGGGGSPGAPLASATTVLVAAGIAVRIRDRRRPRLVLLGGYGSAAGAREFDALRSRLGVEDSQVEVFDYRLAVAVEDHRHASRLATVDRLVPALQAHLERLAADGRPMYLVGHSLGGVALAQLVAGWDRDPASRVTGVTGAALLDPPMAAGLLGALQSAPRLLGFPAHDGGYDPVRTVDGRTVDTRVDLGRRSGVSVVVFRNPKAALTNFWVRPARLRVFDAPDQGPFALGVVVPSANWPYRLWRFVRRVSEAHNSVYGDPRVAECIDREMREVGSCRRLPPSGDG